MVAECADEERTKGTVSEVWSSDLETDISLRETSEVIIVLLSFGTLFKCFPLVSRSSLVASHTRQAPVSSSFHDQLLINATVI